jgi:hypothetical protein
MSRNRFDQIWSSLTFSKHAEKILAMTWEEHCWMLIDDFIHKCNACLETSGKEMFFCNPVSTN